MKYLITLLFFAASLTAFAQTKDLSKISQKKTRPALNELKEFIALPNDANYLEDIDKNIVWLEEAFKKRKFSTQVLKTINTPLFFAERKYPGAKSTILFYMHFDGQSVDPAKWSQKNPYQSTLRKQSGDGNWEAMDWNKTEGEINPDWRIFGRSASDDKGPIVMLLNAIDAMDEHQIEGAVNIKVVLDGEEEKGSKQLAMAVEKYNDVLAADHMVINDGPMHLSGEPTVIFGCRGNVTINLTAYGPKSHQHSGHYGNYAPNPVFRLSQLLASMKDEDGRVIIPGYYDGIDFDADAMAVMAAVPDDIAVIHKTIGIAAPEKVGNNYQESLQYPSLNVRGISAAWVGKNARTIVPAEATAAIDIRLVPESDPDRLISLVKAHIESKGYVVLDREPTMEERLKYPKIVYLEANRKATLPFRTDVNSLTGQWVQKALLNGWGKDPIKVRIMGGTVPTTTFINGLSIPAIIVPLVNADNNQHSPDENLRIGNITNGVRTFMSILMQDVEESLNTTKR